MRWRKKNPGFTREAQIRGVRKALASPKTPPQLKKGLAKRLAHLLAGVNVNPGGKFTKAQVGFEHPAQGMDHCRDCVHFRRPHGCQIVAGTVQAGDWCRKFQAKGKRANFGQRKNPKGKRSKRNPGSAAELFTEFHGRGPKGVFEVHDFSDHPEVAKLGDLCELWTSFESEEVELDWTGEGYKVAGGEVEKIEWGAGEKKPLVAAEPKGKQIYIFGAVELGEIESDKELVDLGDCVLIGYQAEKKFDQFQPQVYQHIFGEEGGVPPRLMYDAVNKRLYLSGGTYKIKADGIVN
jgi:hypothetical protein